MNSWRHRAEKWFSINGACNDMMIIKAGTVQEKVVFNMINRLFMLEQAPSATLLLSSDVWPWHQLLGHLQSDFLRNIRRIVLDPQFLQQNFACCIPCQLGKATMIPHPFSTNCTSRVLILIHSDTSDKQSVHATGGQTYFMTFIDDYSCFITLFLPQNKSYTDKWMKWYRSAIETQMCYNGAKFPSYNGGEYVNSSLS